MFWHASSEHHCLFPMPADAKAQIAEGQVYKQVAGEEKVPSQYVHAESTKLSATVLIHFKLAY